MATQFPIRYARDIPRTAAEDIYRNFAYLAKAIDGAGSVTGWDAIVDPTLSANNTTSKQFTTVFAAVQYLADTLLLTDMTIGVRQTNTSISEVGNYGGTTSGLTVRVVGIGGNVSTWQTAPSTDKPVMPHWNWANFTENSRWQTLIVNGIYVAKNDGVPATQASWFSNAAIVVHSVNSVWDGQGASATTSTCNIPTISALGCLFTDVGFNNSAYLRGCTIGLSRPTSATWNANIVAEGCAFYPASSACTLSLGTSGYIIFDGATELHGATQITTWAIPNATVVSIKTHLPTGIGTQGGIALNITSGVLKQCIVEGYFNELTVPTTATTKGTATIRAQVFLRADITGPARLDLAVGNGIAPTTYGLRLRGGGISGSATLRFGDSAAAATLLDMIGLTRSTIVASCQLDGAASTGTKVYNFDAASSHNILVLEAGAFGAASTDAGSNDLVITDAGLGSATPSGPAGGSLASNYPNPTFAGRFPSVAELEKDFTQAFMLGGMQT